MKKFYRTEFTVIVLSEEPLGDVPLKDLDYLVTEGPCVLSSFDAAEQALDGQQMANALYKAGSEPGFFQLNADGTEENIDWAERSAAQ